MSREHKVHIEKQSLHSVSQFLCFSSSEKIVRHYNMYMDVIHGCTGELRYFLSRYKYKYYHKMSQDYDIVILHWIKKFHIQKNCLLWFLTQVQALSELFLKQWELEKGRVPSLLWNTLHASGQVSFKMAAQKHVQFQLVVSLHSLTFTWTKHMVHLFLATLLCLSVVCTCDEGLYRMSNQGTCIEMCVISREIVLLQPYTCIIMYNVKWPPSVQ